MNKYFIDGNGGLSGNRLTGMKRNCYYLYRALTHIYSTVKNNDAKIGGPYRPALLTGELQYDDTQTGFNTRNLTKKLKYLTVALSDPANISKFKKSDFYSNILIPMSCGTMVDIEEQWLNYKQTSSCEDIFLNKSALDAALQCQRDDLTAPLGLDFSKLIETFVQTDGTGNYYLENRFTTEEEIAMDEAMDAQLKALKSHVRFKASFYNPFI